MAKLPPLPQQPDEDCPIPEYLLDASHWYMPTMAYNKYYEDVVDELLEEMDDDGSEED